MKMFRPQLVLALLLAAVPCFAQAQRGRLLITVDDATGAVIPDAKVTVVGLDDSTKAVAVAPTQTATDGVATFANLAQGRYSVSAEFAGFEPGAVPDVRVRGGDTKQTITLKIQGLQEIVDVAEDSQAGASNRGSQSFGVKVSDDQLANLSDDPDQLQKELQDLAGGNATIRVDSFEGLQLPPKAQIKSVHVTRDQFAAESAYPGNTFIDIITQPGVGPIRGGFNTTMRAGSLSARNPFAPARGVDQNQRYGLNIGGGLAKNKTSFSFNLNGSHQETTPFVYAALPDGGTRSELLRNIHSPVQWVNSSTLIDHALTRDQTLRIGVYTWDFSQRNSGIGSYDSPERAYTNKNTGRTMRVQHAGPIGRRTFVNTRAFIWNYQQAQHSLLEAPTVIVQDSLTTGGAQQRGREITEGVDLNSDLDYIRGKNSWRTGVQFNVYHVNTNRESNYLGTYTFADQAAFLSGTPLLYTQRVGNPSIVYNDIRVGAYLQDDLRVSKGLTISPGVRYTIQPTYSKIGGFEPRFGFTWAPKPGGKTTLRASAGVFHNFMWNGIYDQAIRVDGKHQQEVQVVNPSYPNVDLSAGGTVAPTNKYLLADTPLGASVRYSAGIDEAFAPSFKVNVLYNYIHETGISRGLNLNPLINGVRPDPNYANVIQSVTDGEIRRHELFSNVNYNLAPGQGANKAHLNWKRVSGTASYNWIRARRNAMGAFDPPPTGSLATEWGNGPADSPYVLNLSVNSTQLKNLNVGLSWNARSGQVYNETTGRDDNGDGYINDRPAGVGIWTLRGTPSSTLNARVAYTLTPGAASDAAPASIRYKVTLSLNVNNLTNRANYSGFSGVQTSPFFMQPTSVMNPRRIEAGMNVNF